MYNVCTNNCDHSMLRYLLTFVCVYLYMYMLCTITFNKTLVEVSIAYAEDWKNRDFYPSYHDCLGAHKTERERETERGGVHNKSE